MTRIYTRTGDAGETGLIGGRRVPKDHARVEAYGALDELNSALGAARAFLQDQEIGALLEGIQRDLFALGAEVAAPGDAPHGPPATAAQVEAPGPGREPGTRGSPSPSTGSPPCPPSSPGG